jgi:hypothetical protein
MITGKRRKHPKARLLTPFNKMFSEINVFLALGAFFLLAQLSYAHTIGIPTPSFDRSTS